MRSTRRLRTVPALVMIVSFSIPGWLDGSRQAFLLVGPMLWLAPGGHELRPLYERFVHRLCVPPRRIAARPAAEAPRQPAA